MTATLEDLGHDVRYALRGLVRARVFSVVVILTLWLGMLTAWRASAVLRDTLLPGIEWSSGAVTSGVVVLVVVATLGLGFAIGLPMMYLRMDDLGAGLRP